MSNRTISMATLVAILVLGLTAPTEPASAPQQMPSRAAGPVEPPRITLSNQTTNRQPEEIIEWTVDRYQMAGLQLPDVHVAFYTWEPSKEACSGHGALWTYVDEGHQIDVCAVGARSRRRMLLHEFGHAWTHENLTETVRTTFLEQHGLSAWNDPETDWEQRGIEQAAEVIHWGLYMYCEPEHMIADESQAALAASFRFLTGVDPICEVKER